MVTLLNHKNRLVERYCTEEQSSVTLGEQDDKPGNESWALVVPSSNRIPECIMPACSNRERIQSVNRIAAGNQPQQWWHLCQPNINFVRHTMIWRLPLFQSVSQSVSQSIPTEIHASTMKIQIFPLNTCTNKNVGVSASSDFFTSAAIPVKLLWWRK